ncbi:Hypothetical predicted protein [Olea europaea subsp. europaea]|uniref:Uncharacterized protein n=1 Tax=Olea europaea subsp. europaea TaxID=158383 RepID=A0A8S0QHQ2_OLEEU|nr:Hypothetical predicted protein [Olea europaea subsp. europaea]
MTEFVTMASFEHESIGVNKIRRFSYKEIGSIKNGSSIRMFLHLTISSLYQLKYSTAPATGK